MRKAAAILLVTAGLLLTPSETVLSRPSTPPLASPPNGEPVADFAPTLEWSDPTGPAVTQVHLQVVPANNDGPGVDLVLSLPEPRFQLPPPPQWYGLLPDMTYAWRLRASDATTSVDLEDPSWSEWSPEWTFRSPALDASSLTLTQPAAEAAVASVTPTLVWSDSNPNGWYYEVQVSKDPGFGPNAFLYWELRHGGVTSPPRSYQVPSQFPLEAGSRYYWRVRPRVQGDGTPVAWSAAKSFVTPAPAPGAPLDGQVTAVIDGSTIEVILGGQRRLVRYLGISVPRVSPAECYGAQAAARNSELVEGQTVRLEKDQSETDESGRLLRYVFAGGVMVNAELLKQGLARAAIEGPDTRYESQLRASEAEAREAKRGIWSAPC